MENTNGHDFKENRLPWGQMSHQCTRCFLIWFQPGDENLRGCLPEGQAATETWHEGTELTLNTDAVPGKNRDE